MFTSVHGAGAGSPVGDGGEVAAFRTNSATFGAVPLHDEMVQLFTNWPVKHSPRDPVVALTMRTALRHIGDGIRWAGLDEESPGTGKRLAGAHSLRHSAARRWLMVGRVPLNVVSSWLDHANVQVTPPDLSADRGHHVFDGGSAIARFGNGLGQGGHNV